MHGDKTQRQRENALARFERGEVLTLVATDVAARGIDVPDVVRVFNYDAPEDRAAYVHRIGRTGRAGRTGTGISFVLGDEVKEMRKIAKELDLDVRAAAGERRASRGARSRQPRGREPSREDATGREGGTVSRDRRLEAATVGWPSSASPARKARAPAEGGPRHRRPAAQSAVAAASGHAADRAAVVRPPAAPSGRPAVSGDAGRRRVEPVELRRVGEERLQDRAVDRAAGAAERARLDGDRPGEAAGVLALGSTK